MWSPRFRPSMMRSRRSVPLAVSSSANHKTAAHHTAQNPAQTTAAFLTSRLALSLVLLLWLRLLADSMMGGDEVPLASIQDLPEIKAAAAKLQPGGNATGYDLYRQFIVEMHSYATKAGRELIVWEGFAPADGQTGRSAHPASKVAIPTEGLIVTPFDCFYYPPPQLAADGYKILNSAWTPLYIAGGTGQSPELIYKWNPWLLGNKAPKTPLLFSLGVPPPLLASQTSERIRKKQVC
jgi:hypothetical protein